MKNIFHAIFFINTLLFIFSCNYDPDGEFNSDITQPVAPAAEITINDSDSVLQIGLVTDCYFSTYPDKPLSIGEIAVYIDGNEIPLIENNYFRIDPAAYGFGDHTLVIEITTESSGSGSLADRLGGEAFVYTKEIKLEIENRPPYELDPPEILFLGEENGTFKIEWTEYPLSNFQRYVLYKLKQIHWDGSETYEIITEITHRTQNYYYDSTFIGGIGKYYVFIYAYGGNSSSLPKAVTYPLPKALSAETVGTDLKVVFSKCLFPENFKQYQLYWRFYVLNDLGTITDINDTIVTISKIPFGFPVNLEIATHGRNTDFSAENRFYEPFTSNTVHIGDSSFAFVQMKGVSPCERLYYVYDKVYEYSTVEDRILTSRNISDCNTIECLKLGIPANGNQIIVNDRDNSRAVLYNIPGLEQTKVLDNYTNGNDVSISDNLLMPQASYYDLKLYDFKSDSVTDTLFSSIHGGFYGALSYISPDGLTVYVDSYNMVDSVYEYSNGNYISKPVNHYDKFTLFIDYNLFNPQELIYYSNRRMYFVNKSTLEIIRSFVIPDQPCSNIDPVTGLFLVYEDPLNYDDKLGIYDLETGQRVFQMNANRNFKLRIFNGIIYGSFGHKLKLEL